LNWGLPNKTQRKKCCEEMVNQTRKRRRFNGGPTDSKRKEFASEGDTVSEDCRGKTCPPVLEKQKNTARIISVKERRTKRNASLRKTLPEAKNE
jgi:ATP-dependent Clp protease ATP-binding subunit ClpA